MHVIKGKESSHWYASVSVSVCLNVHLRLLNSFLSLSLSSLGYEIGKCQLTIRHNKGMLIWLMPPANTPNVSPVWNRKLISVCQPFLLMRIMLRRTHTLFEQVVFLFHSLMCYQQFRQQLQFCSNSWTNSISVQIHFHTKKLIYIVIYLWWCRYLQIFLYWILLTANKITRTTQGERWFRHRLKKRKIILGRIFLRTAIKRNKTVILICKFVFKYTRFSK